MNSKTCSVWHLTASDVCDKEPSQQWAGGKGRRHARNEPYPIVGLYCGHRGVYVHPRPTHPGHTRRSHTTHGDTWVVGERWRPFERPPAWSHLQAPALHNDHIEDLERGEVHSILLGEAVHMTRDGQ